MIRLPLLLAILLLLWVGIPAARVAQLTLLHGSQGYPSHPAALPIRSIHFRASDGVPLSGWIVPTSRRAPTIVLVPGFKDDRGSMIPYARMLHAAHFNVLLYDSRGTGASGGRFGFGAREVDDVRGAVAYLHKSRHPPRRLRGPAPRRGKSSAAVGGAGGRSCRCPGSAAGSLSASCDSLFESLSVAISC